MLNLKKFKYFITLKFMLALAYCTIILKGIQHFGDSVLNPNKKEKEFDAQKHRCLKNKVHMKFMC